MVGRPRTSVTAARLTSPKATATPTAIRATSHVGIPLCTTGVVPESWSGVSRMANAPGAPTQIPTMLANRPATTAVQRPRWLETDDLVMTTPLCVVSGVPRFGDIDKVQCHPAPAQRL